jgi:hypothetical protein
MFRPLRAQLERSVQNLCEGYEDMVTNYNIDLVYNISDSKYFT